MKRVLQSLTVLILVFVLAACSGEDYSGTIEDLQDRINELEAQLNPEEDEETFTEYYLDKLKVDGQLDKGSNGSYIFYLKEYDTEDKEQLNYEYTITFNIHDNVTVRIDLIAHKTNLQSHSNILRLESINIYDSYTVYKFDDRNNIHIYNDKIYLTRNTFGYTFLFN